MLGTTTMKRLAATVLVGGVLAVAPAMAPAASAADCGYTGQQTADVSVSLSPAQPTAGNPFTATAHVSVAGAGVPAGSVTFTYNGASNTTSVSPTGNATSGSFIARAGGGSVTADYTGVCVAGAAGVTGHGSATVLGEEASAGGNNGGNSGGNSGNAGVAGTSGSNGISGSSGSTGGLADTGVNTQTELLGLLGLGLVTAGGLSLVVRRRRVQA